MRVVIAEDLALLRDGLERLLRDNGFDVAEVRREANVDHGHVGLLTGDGGHQ